MSLIFSNLVDTLYSEIPNVTGFSTKLILANPFDLEKCTADQKVNGYGIIAGSAEHNILHWKAVRTDREFTVLLTRSVIGEDMSDDNIRGRQKELLTDCQELVDYLTSNTAFTYPTGVIDISAVSSSEISYNSDGGQDRFLSTSVTFSAKIEESLD